MAAHSSCSGRALSSNTAASSPGQLDYQQPGYAPSVAAYPGLVRDSSAPRNTAASDLVPRDPAADAGSDILQKPCLSCLKIKRKCHPASQSLICRRCSSIPGKLCFRLLFSNEPVFAKWDNERYRKRQPHLPLSTTATVMPLEFSHYPQGQSLGLDCVWFSPSDTDQTTYWEKTKDGWRSVQTAALALRDLPSQKCIGTYVEKNMPHAFEEAYLDGKFDELKKEDQDRRLLSSALRIWTAAQLLTKGWRYSHDRTPAPRVVQNQLDALLEGFISKTESTFLNRLQHRLVLDWKSTTSAVRVYLATVERDTWRLMYWPRHRGHYQWRHPETPETLIDRNLTVATLLLGDLLRLADGRLTLLCARLRPGAEDSKLRYDEEDASTMDGALMRVLYAKDGQLHAEDFY